MAIYTRFWGAQEWKNLPQKATPIVAAFLNRVEDFLVEITTNIVNLTAQHNADMAAVDTRFTNTTLPKTTTVNLGTGFTTSSVALSEATPAIALKFGSTSDSVVKGDDTRVVNAMQTPASVAPGDLLYIGGDLQPQRLPKGTNGYLLTQGVSNAPQWTDPSGIGGLPAAQGAGSIAVSLADGTWSVLPGPGDDGMLLMSTKLEGASRPVAWAKMSNLNLADSNIAFTGKFTLPQLGAGTITAEGYQWSNSAAPSVTRKGNEVSSFSMAMVRLAYAQNGTGSMGIDKYYFSNNGKTFTITVPGFLPPEYRPSVKKTFTQTGQSVTLYWMDGSTERNGHFNSAFDTTISLDIDGTITWTHTVRLSYPSYYVKNFYPNLFLPNYSRITTTPTFP